MRALVGTLVLCATGAAAQNWGSLADPRLLTGTTELSSGFAAAAGSVGRQVESRECESDHDCHSSSQCAQKRCVSRPAAGTSPATPTSLRRQGAELYLRARRVQLREELALGRGPMINVLARVEQVPAQQLGRTLREHHAELSALIGDEADPKWSTRFLARVDELCARS